MDTAIAPEPDARDEHLHAWRQQVAPTDWSNPVPDGRYNLVVIGGGPAGLICAAGAAGMGAKVALIERHQLGGDCLNVGCVPSKGLIRAARAAHGARTATTFGIDGAENATADFGRVMSRMYRIRAELSHHDSPTRFSELGVDVYQGDGRFVSPTEIAVGNVNLSFHRAVVTTGARAVIPDVPGLADCGALTNETVFDLKELPRRLVVIGSGPIGCELGQSFARLGSDVTLVEMAGRIMVREEERAAALVTASLEADKVRILTSHTLVSVRREGGLRFVTVADASGTEVEIEADAILIGAGRAPNIESLNLDAAGIDFDPRNGITVDDRLCTGNPRVYAAGDVCFPFKFTHAADACARIVLANALFHGRQKASKLVIPWSTYTSPEVAHVGVTEHDIQQRNLAVDVVEVAMDTNDRSRLDGDDAGYARVYLKPGTDTILGATLVSEHAGDMLGEMVLAMTHNLGLGKIATTIHPYPTNGEIWKKVADAHNRQRLTPTVKKWMTRWFTWRR